MTPTLRDAMLVTHLLGAYEERTLARKAQPGLQLSVFDAVLKKYSNLLGLNLRSLQAQYQTQALRILQDVSDKTEAVLRQSIFELIAEGATVGDAKKVLYAQFDKLGLTPKNEFQLETIFRTQTQLAYGAGRWEADQDPDIQEILWGYTYSAVGDDRTRETHLALDGVTLPKDDPFWERFWPPNGWNCRCQVIPVFEPERAVKPPSLLGDGTPVLPDRGFEFNPGRVFSTRAL
jgi:SPP1 gp7 family putative phage head morphogenesis protein